MWYASGSIEPGCAGKRWGVADRTPAGPATKEKSAIVMDKRFSRSSVLLVIGVSSFMGALDIAVVNIVLPVIQKDLSTSVRAVQWISVAFLVTASGLLPVFGRLGDLWGHRTIFLCGIFVFTLFTLLCGLAPTVGWLIVFRVLQAVGSAMVVSVATALLIRHFPPEHRGRVLGLQLTMTYLGLITGPTLGGLAAQFWNWRVAFWINAPVGIALFLSAWWVLPKGVHGERERFDVAGAVMLFTAVVSGLLGITGVGGRAGAGGQAGLLLLGVLSGVCFARRELRLESRGEPALIRLSLFRNTAFSLSAGVALAGYTCEYFVIFLSPFYLMRVLGLSGGLAGLLLTAKSVVMVFVAPVCGNLSDRVGPRPLSLAGMGCYAASLTLQARLTGESPLLWVAALLILTGIAIGFFVSPNNSAMMGAVPPSDQGVASAVLALVRNLGIALGVALSGTFLAFRPESVLDGFRLAMVFGAGIAVVGVILSAFQQSVPVGVLKGTADAGDEGTGL
ncbi:MAG TPA: MFS transporter [bacterium]|nr:MFS transporter [bacterium]